MASAHLEVALVPVDDEFLPGVDDLHVGEVALVLLLHRLVNTPVGQLSSNEPSRSFIEP